MNRLIKTSLAAMALAASAGMAQAQDATIRIHHFMSAKAPLHSKFLVPFAERVAAADFGEKKKPG